LFIFSLLLRVAIVIAIRPFIFFHANIIDIFGDGANHMMNGYLISETLKSDLTQVSTQMTLNRRFLLFIPHLFERNVTSWSDLLGWGGALPYIYIYQVTGLSYFLSMLYYFFGFKPVMGIFINCLIGTILILSVYAIVKKITNNYTSSRIAAVLTSFFPSLFLWSITNQKDIIIISLSSAILLCLIKILKERKLDLFFVIIPLSFIIFSLGYNQIFQLLLFYILFSVSILLLWVFKKKRVLFTLAISLFISFAVIPKARILSGNAIGKVTSEVHDIFTDALMRHVDQTREGGTFYRIVPQYYYPFGAGVKNMPFKQIIGAYFLGVIHFAFEPFPSRIHNFSTLLSYPQTILSCFLLIFFILGAIATLRKDFSIFIILFLFYMLLSTTVILGEGNAGSLFRHRDIVAPIFIIFSSIGISNLMGANKYYKRD